MFNWQKLIATGLVACMLVLPLGDLALSLEAAAPPNPTLTKQQVDRWGVGAEVKVKLAGGKNLRGAISGIEDESFLLVKGQKASPKRVGYAEVAELKQARDQSASKRTASSAQRTSAAVRPCTHRYMCHRDELKIAKRFRHLFGRFKYRTSAGFDA